MVNNLKIGVDIADSCMDANDNMFFLEISMKVCMNFGKKVGKYLVPYYKGWFIWSTKVSTAYHF